MRKSFCCQYTNLPGAVTIDRLSALEISLPVLHLKYYAGRCFWVMQVIKINLGVVLASYDVLETYYKH